MAVTQGQPIAQVKTTNADEYVALQAVFGCGRRLRPELENVLGFFREDRPRQLGVLVLLVRAAEL